MLKILFNFFKSHTALSIGAAISIVFLVTFFFFQHFQAEVLKLESRWLIVSGVPLLAALLVGGYIKSFKGFGVELEASLKKPIKNIKLTATEAMQEFQGDEKRNINYLNQLSDSKKRAISRLVLVEGKADYYNSNAIEIYMRELTGLKYIEIKNLKGEFVALLPIRQFKQEPPFIFDVLDEFILALENKEILQRYSSSVITSFIPEETDILEALKEMRKKRLHKLVVLNENYAFVGLLLSSSIERKIVDNVLAAKENA